MPYAKATVEVLFEYPENVPAPLAATRITANLLQGDVIAVAVGGLEPVTEAEIVQATGGCGECSGCQTTIAEMAVRSVPAEASEAEDAAVERARSV